MKTAYSYQRWSTALQGKSGKDSKSRQTDTAQDWLNNYGKEYSLSKETFVDAGKSGFKGEHVAEGGELLRFIQLVEAGTIKKGSILLIDEYSRFSRLKPTKSLALFTRVLDAGIGLVFTGSYDKRIITPELLDKDAHVLQFIIGEMIRSFTESEEKSRKIKSAKQAKLEQLKAGMIVPHNNVPKYISYNKESKTYEHNHNTPLVQQMVKDFLNGNSLYSIAKKFNEQHIPTFRRGFEWHPKSVKCILQNRVLIGEFLGNTKFCKPIIDKDDYEKVQSMLAKHTWIKSGRDGENLANMFRGLSFCSECGRTMHLTHQSTHKGKTLPTPYRYLRCSTSSNGQNCSNRNYMNAELFEAEFFVEFLMKTPAGLLNANDSEVNTIRKTISQRQTDKAGIDKQIDKLAKASEVLNLEQLIKEGSRLKKESNILQTEIDRLSEELRRVQGAPVDLDNLKEIVQDLRKTDITIEDMIESDSLYDFTVKKVIEHLKDNEVRKKIRTLLPSIIGSVKVYTQVGDTGAFEVLDRNNSVIYRSMEFGLNE